MSLRRSFLLAAALILSALVLLVMLMDWNWLRGPAQRAASAILQREVMLGHLEVRPGLSTLVRLRDVRVANTEWSQVQPMAVVREIEFTIRLSSILAPPRVLPHLRLTDADVLLERLPDGRANWEFGRDGEQGVDHGDRPPAVELHGLRIDGARLAYRDEKLNIRADAHAQTRNDDARYPTSVEFSGNWDGAPFRGLAQAGSVLSISNSNQPFPLKVSMRAGETTLEAEGEVTDVVSATGIDMQLMITGPSLASLYPTLRLALPASPPYRFDGRLSKRGNTYGYAQFSGTVGGSDIAGDGELVIEVPRPRLTASLRSKRVNLDDLGPLIGVQAAEAALSRGARPQQATPTERRRGMRPDEGKDARKGQAAAKKTQHHGVPPSLLPAADAASAGTAGRAWLLHPVTRPHSPRSWMPPPRSGDEKQEQKADSPPTGSSPSPRDGRGATPPKQTGATAARAAQSKDRSANAKTPAAPGDASTGSRVLPTADFSGERLGVIDADVHYAIDTLRLPTQRLTWRDVRVRALLQDGELRIDPLRLRFAGGEVLGSIVLDGRVTPNRLRAAADLRRLELAELIGPVDKLKQSGGRVGAQVRLEGRGPSVADLFATADGAITLGMSGGQVSHLVLAAASLNGGRLLQLALGGDQPSEIRCAGVALNIEKGVGTVQPLVFDTEHVRIDGDGQLNFRQERFALELRPQPKEPNLLSVRGPLHVRGSFNDLEISLDPSVVARAGAAAALALVNPLAALIPLIETGGGEDSHCGEVLAPVAGAAEQARSGSSDVPPAEAASQGGGNAKGGRAR